MRPLAVATRAKWAGRLLVGSIVLLLAVVGWLVFEDVEQGNQLGGVKRAAPCRTDGITSRECKRQSRLIFRACVRFELHPACKLAKLAIRAAERRDAPIVGKPPTTEREGVTPQPSPPPASQPPAPPSSGAQDEGSMHGEPKPGPGPGPGDPPDPPDEAPALLDPVCDLELPTRLC